MFFFFTLSCFLNYWWYGFCSCYAWRGWGHDMELHLSVHYLYISMKPSTKLLNSRSPTAAWRIGNVIKILTLDFFPARVMMSDMSVCVWFMIQIVYVCTHTSCSMCVCVFAQSSPLPKYIKHVGRTMSKRRCVSCSHCPEWKYVLFRVACLASVIIISSCKSSSSSSTTTTTIHNDINHGLQPVPCRGCFKETVWRIFPLKHWKLPRTSSWPCVV